MKGKYISGHCLLGNCEGTSNLSPKGALMPACRGEYYWYTGANNGVSTCNHECHNKPRKLLKRSKKLSRPAELKRLKRPAKRLRK